MKNRQQKTIVKKGFCGTRGNPGQQQNIALAGACACTSSDRLHPSMSNLLLSAAQAPAGVFYSMGGSVMKNVTLTISELVKASAHFAAAAKHFALVKKG